MYKLLLFFCPPPLFQLQSPHEQSGAGVPDLWCTLQQGAREERQEGALGLLAAVLDLRDKPSASPSGGMFVCTGEKQTQVWTGHCAGWDFCPHRHHFVLVILIC